MVKTILFTFRIPDYLLAIIDGVAQQNKVTKTKVATVFLEKGLLNPELIKNLSEELKSDMEIYSLKNNRRKTTNRLYIIKNMYQRVMDMAMSSFFTVGDVNMKAVEIVIDSFEKEFNCYTKKEREILEIGFKTAVKQLRDETYLMSNTEKIKLLRQK